MVDDGFDFITDGTNPADRNYMVMSGVKTSAAAATASITCTARASGNYLNGVITAVKVGSIG